MTKKSALRITWVLLAAALLSTQPASGQLPTLGRIAPPAGDPDVAVALAPAAAAPGEPTYLAITLTIRDGLWLYSPTPRGKLTQPQALALSVDAGDWNVGEVRYPRPAWHSITIAGLTDSNLVYQGEITLYAPIEPPATATGDSHPVSVRVRGQTCDDKGCYPVDVRRQVAVALAADAAAAGQIPEQLKTAEQWDTMLPHDQAKAAAVAATTGDHPGADLATLSALALALVAGIALNIMPCVLPVIPIKIMSLLQQAQQSRRRSITLGLAYAGGICLFFAAMGAISVAVRLTTGAAFNLNEPFGNPWFLIGLSLLLVAAAAWLFGLFTPAVGGRLGGLNLQEGHIGSVVMGFVTAVLATPCSGPVLVTVFGWAQGQPAWAGAAVFVALGLGMGAPHAILAAMPRLLERLPGPGAWMERLKQVMGLVLLLVAVWLISTLGVAAWIARVTGYAVIFTGCLWMAGSWVTLNTPPARRRAVRGLALLIAVVAGWFMLAPPEPEAIAWRPMDTAAIEAEVADGNVVVVKFTASWCTVCMILDYKTYDRADTAAALDERGVIPMKADVTRDSSAAAKMLSEELGEPGPPVTLVYGPSVDQPIRLHGVFSRDELLEAVDRAMGPPNE